MRIIKPLCLGLLTRPYEFAGRSHLGAAVLCVVPLGPEPALFSEIGLWKMLAEELPPEQPLDAGIPKRNPEFLVTGRAYAPGGRPARAVRVTARLGERTKQLLVAGDRHWEPGSGATEPAPFTEMPLDWSRAFGGPRFAENPLGRGMEEVPIPGVGHRVPLANIEDPALPPEQRQRRPAGFGPIDQTWPQRQRLAGTYDDRWLREDYPGFARDIDWRFFNTAPPDQQFARPLTGEEEYALENLHPQEPLLAGRLPGIAPRLFLVRRGAEDALEEVALALTTVWFFPHRRRAVLVHHGVAPIAEEDGRDILRAVVGADRIGAQRDAAHYRRVMEARLDPEHGALLALRDADLAPAELLVPDPDMEAQKPPAADGDLLQTHMRRRTERQVEEARAIVASYGLDPDEHAPPRLPPPEPVPDLDSLPAFIARTLAEADRKREETERLSAEREKDLEQVLAGSGLTMEQLQAERTARPAGPPAFTAAGMRRDLEALAQSLRASGADAAEVEQILADPKMNRLWETSEAEQRRIYQQTAHLQDPAPAMPGARRRRIRREVETAGTGGSFAGSNLAGADLSGLVLAGADFTGAWLDGADLTGADLRGAKFAGAVLAHARLDSSRMDGADLTGANLGAAHLGGASLREAKLRQAILARADLRGTSLRGADLEGADLSGARFEGADLAGLRAPGLLLMKLSLPGLSAPGAVLDNAVFLECDLSGADLGGASLLSATFLKASARGLRAAGADLRKAVFVDGCDLEGAVLARANLAEANLRGARLAGADLAEALLDGADLSDCALAAARLFHVRARGARLVAADLRRAVLARGDFMGGMLSRADLRGADLTEASFYEADLARVQTDQETRHQGMLQTRMRVRPRHRPQAAATS